MLLDPLGEVRLDTYDHDRLPRRPAVPLRHRCRSIPAIDLFNLTNSNTVQAINRQQAATNANTVSGIIAPRVARFGVNVRW